MCPYLLEKVMSIYWLPTEFRKIINFTNRWRVNNTQKTMSAINSGTIRIWDRFDCDSNKLALDVCMFFLTPHFYWSQRHCKNAPVTLFITCREKNCIAWVSRMVIYRSLCKIALNVWIHRSISIRVISIVHCYEIQSMNAWISNVVHLTQRSLCTMKSIHSLNMSRTKNQHKNYWQHEQFIETHENDRARMSEKRLKVSNDRRESICLCILHWACKLFFWTPFCGDQIEIVRVHKWMNECNCFKCAKNNNKNNNNNEISLIWILKMSVCTFNQVTV